MFFNNYFIFKKEAEYFYISASVFLVELEGFEPSSKQAAKLLSTCLAFIIFQQEPDKGVPIHCYISFNFRSIVGASIDLFRLFLMFPWGRSRT